MRQRAGPAAGAGLGSCRVAAAARAQPRQAGDAAAAAVPAPRRLPGDARRSLKRRGHTLNRVGSHLLVRVQGPLHT